MYNSVKGLPISKPGPYSIHNLPIALLLDSYRYLIVSIVNKYCTLPSYRDDLMQAAYAGLLKAKETYNPKKKSKFSSWAYFKINWEVQKERNNFYLTRCSPNWRKNRPETYDTLEDSSIDPGLSPLEELCRKEEWEEKYAYLRNIMDRLHKKLTPSERSVFLSYYIHNKRVSDIKKNIPNAYRIIERLKEKIHLLLLLDGR